MRIAVVIASIALLAPAGRADWKDLKQGADQQTAWNCAGVPLLQNHGRGGAESWTYDKGGYILFEYGRVIYWEAPRAQQAPEPKHGIAQQTPPAPKRTTAKPSKSAIAAN